MSQSFRNHGAKTSVTNLKTLVELDKNERPLYPPKIISVRIVDNPFDDIVPRITAAEKRAQQLARETAQREREEAARRKGAKKYVTWPCYARVPPHCFTPCCIETLAFCHLGTQMKEARARLSRKSPSAGQIVCAVGSVVFIALGSS